MFALTPKPLLAKGLSRLRAELTNGAWTHRHADLLDKPQLDLGYRLVVSDFELALSLNLRGDRAGKPDQIRGRNRDVPSASARTAVHPIPGQCAGVDDGR